MFERIGVMLRVVVALAWVLLVVPVAVAAPEPGGWPLPFPAEPGPPPPDSPTTGPAAPLDPRSAKEVTDAVASYAQQVAVGMTADGPMVAGTFKEGEVLAQPIQLLPGKCYTVVAVGTGITEVGITLEAVTPLPGGSNTLAEDRETGPRAALGGRGNCFKYPLPISANARFVIKAGRGSGVAAGQVYVK